MWSKCVFMYTYPFSKKKNAWFLNMYIIWDTVRLRVSWRGRQEEAGEVREDGAPRRVLGGLSAFARGSQDAHK